MAVPIEGVSAQVSPAVAGAATVVQPDAQSQDVESSAKVEENVFSSIQSPLEAAPKQVLEDKRAAAAELNSALQSLGEALETISKPAVDDPFAVDAPRGWQPLDVTDIAALEDLNSGATVTVSYAGNTTNVPIGPGAKSLRAMSKAVEAMNGDNAWRSATGTTGVGEGPFQSGVIRPGVIPADQPSNVLTQAIAEFAEAYNNVQAAYEGKGEEDGPLAEDETASSVLSQLDAAVSQTFPAAEGAFQSLSDVGVQPSQDGRLEVQTARLEAAVEESPEDAVSLFSSDGGPGGAIRAAIAEVYVDPLRGSLASGGLEPSIRATEQQVASNEVEIGELGEALKDRMTQLESAVQELSETSTYLQENLSVYA